MSVGLIYVFWGFGNILCPSGSSNSIFIKIAISIAELSNAYSNDNKNDNYLRGTIYSKKSIIHIYGIFLS